MTLLERTIRLIESAESEDRMSGTSVFKSQRLLGGKIVYWELFDPDGHGNYKAVRRYPGGGVGSVSIVRASVAARLHDAEYGDWDAPEVV